MSTSQETSLKESMETTPKFLKHLSHRRDYRLNNVADFQLKVVFELSFTKRTTFQQTAIDMKY